MAIDEERSSFGPTLWTIDPRADQHVEQVWFAGVHSDGSGGRPDLLGTLRQSCTAFYRLLPRLIRRPGAKDPHHESAPSRPRHVPGGLIERLDADGPVILIAPTRQPQHRRDRHEDAKRDRVNKAPLVESATTVGRMR